jgi:hypothetical protein
MKELITKVFKMNKAERIERLRILSAKGATSELTTSEENEAEMIQSIREQLGELDAVKPANKEKVTYYDESESTLKNKMYKLEVRRETIKAELNGNSPASLFRELSMINYKLTVAESHLKKTFRTEATQTEYYTRVIQ